MRTATGLNGTWIVTSAVAAAFLLASAFLVWHLWGLQSLSDSDIGTIRIGLILTVVVGAAALFTVRETLANLPMRKASTIKESAQQAAGLIGPATREVLIASGHGNRDFWNEQSRAGEALTNAIENGASVRMLIAHETDELAPHLLRLAKKPSFELRQAGGHFEPHFMVVDEAILRLEDNHERGAATRQGLEWHNALAAAELRTYFNEWWTRAQPLRSVGSLESTSDGGME